MINGRTDPYTGQNLNRKCCWPRSVAGGFLGDVVRPVLPEILRRRMRRSQTSTRAKVKVSR